MNLVPDFSDEQSCEWAAELILKKYLNTLNRNEPITAKKEAITGMAGWFQQAYIQGLKEEDR